MSTRWTVRELADMDKETWMDHIDSQDVDEDSKRPPPKVEWWKK